jgi:MFS transporter, DHA1 family, tetracycline resistance protein
LVIYYIQERIGFTDTDVANFFMLVGLLGIFMQGVVLKHANTIFGERMLLILCFLIAAIHNAWYGISHTKSSIFMAASIGTIGAMAFPTISAVKANNVESSEQGRIQGALYSVSAVASAIGPIGMRFVYHYTKDGIWFGPGSMFIVAAIVNCFAVYCAYLLPVRYYFFVF